MRAAVMRREQGASVDSPMSPSEVSSPVIYRRVHRAAGYGRIAYVYLRTAILLAGATVKKSGSTYLDSISRSIECVESSRSSEGEGR
jgi:hypothetical protein